MPTKLLLQNFVRYFSSNQDANILIFVSILQCFKNTKSENCRQALSALMTKTFNPLFILQLWILSISDLSSKLYEKLLRQIRRSIFIKQK